MSYRDDFWGGFTPSKPIKVEGGIKAKSNRGSIGDTLWSKRWVSVLESFGWSNSLERRRRFAREVPLSADGFWDGGELESFSVNITAPDVPAAIIKRLGTPQFWDRQEDFNKKMEKYYKEISKTMTQKNL